MALDLQSLTTVLVVLGAVGYLAHRLWRSYARLVEARRAGRASSPCGSQCGCDH